MQQPVEIIPKHGLTIVRFGDTPLQAKSGLVEQRFACDYYEPTRTLYCEELKSEFNFTSGDAPELFQIIISDSQMLVIGRPVIEQRLDKVLLSLHVSTFSDTLWSYVDVCSEFVGGVLIDDAKRPRKCKPEALISEGTLWIKSLGLGLSLRHGMVESICMRRPEDVPQVGCGELQQEHLQDIISPKLFPSIGPSVSLPIPQMLNRRRTSGATRMIAALMAVLFVAVPGWLIYRDITAWRNSIETIGTVIETRPPGPFPDELVVQYLTQDQKSRQVVLSTNYATAREVGETVDLLYRPERPDQAMTRVQTRDEGWSISPYLLFGSFAAATFCLAWAFPESIRLRSRR